MSRWYLCLVLLTGGAGAQETTTRVPLTLREALDKARLNSPRLGQLAALREAADAGWRGAKAGRWPQLELQAAYSFNSDVPEFATVAPGPPPTRVLLYPNIPNQYRTRASLWQPLYTGGRVQNGVHGAEAQKAAADGDLLAAQNDLTLETRTAYWSLVAARESTRVLREAVAAFESHTRDARNRENVGMAARNEVLAVQVQRDQSELSRLQAANAADVANANLLRLTGLPPGTEIEPVEPRTASEEQPAAVEELVAAGLEARPELAALRSRVAYAEASAQVSRASKRPQAGLSAAYDYSRPNTRIFPLVDEWNGTWSVGASVSWSVFDGGRTSTADAQAQAQAEAARRQLDDWKSRVRLEVTSRRLDLETARAALSVAERNLVAAEENLRVSRDRYREGVALSSDLLDAETALLRAGLDETQAVIQLRLAHASLERAVGR